MREGRGGGGPAGASGEVGGQTVEVAWGQGDTWDSSLTPVGGQWLFRLLQMRSKVSREVSVTAGGLSGGGVPPSLLLVGSGHGLDSTCFSFTKQK